MWHLVKFNTTVAVNFSNTCICTLRYTLSYTLPYTLRALTVNLQKRLYNSQPQVSVGDRQYTIILFVSNIFLPTILNYLNDRERGHDYLLWDFSISQCPGPLRDATILYYLNAERRGAIILCRISARPNDPTPSPDATILNYLDDQEKGSPIVIIL